MALDERFVVAPSLEMYFVDKDSGEPLSAGTVEFFKDNSRITPKTVFQLTGAPPNYSYIPLPNPITLSNAGTIQNAGGDNLIPYFFPFDADGELDLYYIVIKDSSGAVMFTRQAWPNLTESTQPLGTENNVQNALSNPQWSTLLFDTDNPFDVTVAAATNEEFIIAPDWTLVLSGTGTLRLQRIDITGSSNFPTNPPYVLDIEEVGSGLTKIELVQRLNQTPAIWSSRTGFDSFVAAHMIAKSEDGSPHTVSMTYRPSSGASTTLFSDSAPPAEYAEINNITQIPISTSVDNPTTGYVDIVIGISLVSHVRISSIQAVNVENEVTTVEYSEDTIERQEDRLFHYYNLLLQQKAVPSYLVGWDFPLNPSQFNGGAVSAATSRYIWDQTIAFQSVASSLTFARSASGYKNLEVQTLIDGQLALIQYVEESVARELLADKFSVNVAGSATTAISGNVTVWYTTDVTLPDITTGDSIVLTLDADGKPASFNGTWTEIPTSLPDNSKFTFETRAGARNPDYSLTGWDGTQLGAPATRPAEVATFVAIVVGTTEIEIGDVIDIESISLTKGEIPTRPSPQSLDTVLTECQRYYEKSYRAEDPPGFVTTNGALYFKAILEVTPTTHNHFAEIGTLMFNWKASKYSLTAPLTVYSPDGTINTIQMGLTRWGVFSLPPINVLWTFFSLKGSEKQERVYTPLTGAPQTGLTGLSPSEAVMFVHYVLDSRLGVV